MTPDEARLLRDGLRACLVTRDQWCELVVRWLADVDIADFWMLDMLEAREAEHACAGLEKGWPDLPDVERDEDAVEREPWPLLGFLFLRHERGLPLWETLNEAMGWCEVRFYWDALGDLSTLRSDLEYCQSVCDGIVPVDEMQNFENRAQIIFEKHRAAALCWWENPA